MEEFKKLYFTLFSDVAYVIEEFQGNPIYEPIIKRLIEAELKTEEMYMDMDIPSDEEEYIEDDEEEDE